jgi:hypothetical protein
MGNVAPTCPWCLITAAAEIDYLLSRQFGPYTLPPVGSTFPSVFSSNIKTFYTIFQAENFKFLYRTNILIAIPQSSRVIHQDNPTGPFFPFCLSPPSTSPWCLSTHSTPSFRPSSNTQTNPFLEGKRISKSFHCVEYFINFLIGSL